MLKQRLPRKLSNIKVSQFIRRRTIRKVMGGGWGGELSSRRNFSSLSNYVYEFFLGLIGVQEFFSFNFPLREFFFLYFARPTPDKFSNGPSLNPPLNNSALDKMTT